MTGGESAGMTPEDRAAAAEARNNAGKMQVLTTLIADLQKLAANPEEVAETQGLFLAVRGARGHANVSAFGGASIIAGLVAEAHHFVQTQNRVAEFAQIMAHPHARAHLQAALFSGGAQPATMPPGGTVQ